VAIAVTAASIMALRSVPTGEIPYTSPDKAGLLMERAEHSLAEGAEDKAVSDLTMVINRFGDSGYSNTALRKLAAIYSARGEDEKVVYCYGRLLEDFPDIDDAEDIRSRLEKLIMKKFISSGDAEESAEYTVQPGDSLYVLAKKFNTTVALIKKTNNLESDMIRVGQKLKINMSKFSILVDKSDNILVLKKDGEPFKTYTVSTGKDGSTPAGVFQVVDKMISPPWTKPGVGVIMPDSEEYELGARWIPISLKGYGIHGTNDESSIGGQVTAGCVRMHNDDVVELYDIIPVGTEVKIVD